MNGEQGTMGVSCRGISGDTEGPRAIDMHGKTIRVGAHVRIYGTIKNMLKEKPIAEGKVYSLTGLHGDPETPAVWIDGHACHHPQACEVFFPEDS